MKSILKVLFCVSSGAVMLLAAAETIGLVCMAAGFEANYGEKGWEMYCKILSDGMSNL